MVGGDCGRHDERAVHGVDVGPGRGATSDAEVSLQTARAEGNSRRMGRGKADGPPELPRPARARRRGGFDDGVRRGARPYAPMSPLLPEPR